MPAYPLNVGDLDRAGAVAAATAVSVPTIATSHALITGQPPAWGLLAPAAAAAFAAAFVIGALVPALAPRVMRSRFVTMISTGVALLAGHATLTALASGSATAGGAGCLPAIGRGAQLGFRLALLQHDAACPTGTLTAGPAASALTPILLALAILASHALAAVAAGVLAGMARAAVAAAAVVRRAVPLLCGGPLTHVVIVDGSVRPSLRIVRRRVPRLRKVLLSMHPVRRGPPLVLAGI